MAIINVKSAKIFGSQVTKKCLFPKLNARGLTRLFRTKPEIAGGLFTDWVDYANAALFADNLKLFLLRGSVNK